MEDAKLWEKYAKSPTAELREKLILKYAPLVKIVAGRLSMYLGYNVQYEDLCSYGVFGLIDAIDKFDYTKGNKFETYASLRIRGSILDYIRKMDWIPRSLRQKQRQMDAALVELEASLGRPATDAELAAKLGISEDEFYEWQGEVSGAGLVSLDEFVEVTGGEKAVSPLRSAPFETPEEVVEKEEMKRLLMEALSDLNEKEKMVITLYYYEEMNLKEISAILEVSESRVSQLHTKALGKMKSKLGKQLGLVFG